MLIGFAPSGIATRHPMARRLVFIWLIQTIALTASAAWRLKLYVNVYSLSHFRMNAIVWMILVALGLFCIMTRIHQQRTNRWLINTNLFTLLITLYLYSFVNSNALIASINVKNCKEVGGNGVAIDLPYLIDQGVHALPALDWLASQPVDRDTLRRIDDASRKLRDKAKKRSDSWQSWTFAVAQKNADQPAPASESPTDSP